MVPQAPGQPVLFCLAGISRVTYPNMCLGERVRESREGEREGQGEREKRERGNATAPFRMTAVSSCYLIKSHTPHPVVAGLEGGRLVVWAPPYLIDVGPLVCQHLFFPRSVCPSLCKADHRVV